MLAINESASTYIGLDFGRVDGRSAQGLPERSMSGYVLGLRGQHRLPQGLQLQLEVFAGRPIAKPAFIENGSISSGMSLSVSF